MGLTIVCVFSPHFFSLYSVSFDKLIQFHEYNKNFHVVHDFQTIFPALAFSVKLYPIKMFLASESQGIQRWPH